MLLERLGCCYDSRKWEGKALVRHVCPSISSDISQEIRISVMTEELQLIESVPPVGRKKEEIKLVGLNSNSNLQVFG